jgi:hypothetical protein
MAAQSGQIGICRLTMRLPSTAARLSLALLLLVVAGWTNWVVGFVDQLGGASSPATS